MKKKILVIINDYLPIKSADSYCLQNIIEVLKERYEVHIVTAGDRRETTNIDDVYIYGVSKGAYIDQNIIRQISIKCKSSTLKKILQSITRIFFKAVKFLIWPDLSVFQWHRIKKKCNLLLNSNEYLSLITVSGSYTSQIVGLSLKKKRSNIEWISLLYDPLPIDSFIYMCGLMSFLKRKLSRDILRESDLCLTTVPLMERYKNLRSKDILECGLPMVKKMSTKAANNIRFDSKMINLLYVGTLNLKIRNPEYWFRMVAASLHKESICIHIVGDVGCLNIAKKYGIERQCIIYGTLDKHEIEKLYHLNSILINVGNYVSFQLPSKILEYISTGLPVVSIEPNVLSSTNHILDKYQNAIIIDENNCFYENVDIFDSFIIKPIKKIPFNVIESCFQEHTPQWNANRISSLIEGVVK